MKQLPQRKRTHLADFTYAGTDDVYFVTICAQGKRPYFNDPQCAQMVADEMTYRAHTAREVTVFAQCIMPDHLHVVLRIHAGYGKTLQNWIAAFKRHTARTAALTWGIKPLWQANFYEHIVRKEESLNTIAEYIVNNPVRKGMVREWREYPFSMIDYEAFK
jgi:REP element-mobilizing transposase RayT